MKDICIVMLSAIGDAVHVLPVANAIKRHHPDSRITWIIQPVPKILAEGHPAIDEFIVFHRTRGVRGLKGFTDLREKLKGRRFDLVIALQVYLKAGVITGMVDADRILGFDRKRARDANWLFTNERIAPHEEQHVQDQYFEFLLHLGIDPSPVEWRIELTEEERADQAAFFEAFGGPACAVVVGTSKEEKNWNAAGYAEVIDRLAEKHGVRSILVGGPSERERAIADDVLRLSTSDPMDLLGNDLRRLIWILDRSALTLSPDTGPLHISRALDTPVVGLYGYTNPKRTGPYVKYQELVVDGYAAYPGEDYPVTREYRDGMKRVTPQMVHEKIDLAVERYGTG